MYLLPNSGHDWEEVAHHERPSWYLDPVVAAQKKRINLELIRRWSNGLAPERVLKTDVFEEAYGADDILFDVPAPCRLGNDIAPPPPIKLPGGNSPRPTSSPAT